MKSPEVTSGLELGLLFHTSAYVAGRVATVLEKPT